MLKLFFVFSIYFVTYCEIYGQLTSFYTLKENKNFDTVEFHLKAGVANCLLKTDPTDIKPLTIYGNPDLDKINPSFKTQIKNRTCYAKINLNEYNPSSYSFSKILTRNNQNKNFWKINLNENIIYRLNLSYGLGSADINLNQSAVQRLKITSGSADIVVGYDNNNENPIVMDTLFLKVDFGSIQVNKMERIRAKNVITKIGFGNVRLDYKYMKQKCNVKASVGAGNLEIILPQDKRIPVIIHLEKSLLCSVQMASDYEEVEENIYINKNYHVDAENLLSFYVEVALGLVHFKYEE